jgi:hypothetical protein
MDTNEIVVHEVNCDRMSVVLNLLRECIGEPDKAPDRHSHCEILALDVGRADVPRIGIAGNFVHARPDAFGLQMDPLPTAGQAASNSRNIGMLDVVSGPPAQFDSLVA